MVSIGSKAMKQANNIIEVEQLSIKYDDKSILENVNFSCHAGEFVSIVGKSGTGKSSFLNALANFIPYTGYVKIPSDIGYIFQNYALFPWMTVEDNIGFGIENKSKSEKENIIQQLLLKIEMTAFAKRYPSQLSGGQIQRVALARAFAKNPSIVLADEPYGALDHHTRDKMHEWLLSTLNESIKTVIFVTHYIEEALFLSDRVVVLKDHSFIANIEITFAKPRTNQLKFSADFIAMKEKILSFM
jgi:NitT/TauT family transport system ATP-binding protein